MNQSSVEKNGWDRQTATSSRPVAARANLTAAVVASEPFLANLTMSAPGTCSRNSSAARSSYTEGRLKLTPSSARFRHGLDDGRIGVPERHRPQPHAVLDVPVAVDVLHVRPVPRAITGAMPSGYWSDPRA